jgi:ribulose-bisphosphate carboxylase small chain
MRITQGTFSFLPDLTDAQIARQVEYALGKGWALSLETTDDAHPRNVYWELWGAPMFDLTDPAAFLRELAACRRAHPDRYVKVSAFDATSGWESMRLSFLVQRPAEEPGFELVREDGPGRTQRYGLRGHAASRPAGERHGGGRG